MKTRASSTSASRRAATRFAALALASAALVVGAAAAGASTRPENARAGVASAGGFGSTLAAFAHAHPEDVGACPDTTCYGPLVASAPPTYEFSFLQVDKGRVVGYEQAIKRGTPLLEAELEVAELFPADAQANKIEVIKRDLFGASCGVYDIYSHELKAAFGPHAFGDDGGNVGVELATLNKSGTTSYNPNAIDLAIIMPTYADSGIDC